MKDEQSPTSFRLSERVATNSRTYPSIDQETRHAVPTDCAAWHLNRRPQTMRLWSCYENGPIRPTRINGRLAWKTDDLRRVLGVLT